MEYYKTNKSEWSRSLPLNVYLIPSLYFSAVNFSYAYRPYQVVSTRFWLTEGRVQPKITKSVSELTKGYLGVLRTRGCMDQTYVNAAPFFYFSFLRGRMRISLWRVETSGEGGGVGLCVVALHYNHFLMSYLISSCCVWQKSFAFDWSLIKFIFLIPFRRCTSLWAYNNFILSKYAIHYDPVSKLLETPVTRRCQASDKTQIWPALKKQVLSWYGPLFMLHFGTSL